MAGPIQDDELAPYVLHDEDVAGLDRLGKKKGSGAYGAVYEVTVRGVPCIAKRILDILVDDEVSQDQKEPIQEKFRQECILLSKLKHPNVVHFVGVHYGWNRGDLSLIMERLHMNLAKFLEPTKPQDARDIPISVKISILLDVIYGVHYMHSLPEPVLHRDLSANNVLLTINLKAKVADLGVSKLLDPGHYARATARHTKAPGAQNYMPPEALKEVPVYGKKIDVFSYGHLALYTATQQFPEVDEPKYTKEEFAHAGQGTVHIFRRQKSFGQMGDEHPLRDVVDRCLRDRPEERPTTKELVESLTSLYSHHPMTRDDVLRANGECSGLEHELETMRQKLQELKTELQQSQSVISQQQQQIQHLDRVREELQQSQSKVRQQQQQIQQFSSVREELHESQRIIKLQKQEIQRLSASRERVDRLQSITLSPQSGQPIPREGASKPPPTFEVLSSSARTPKAPKAPQAAQLTSFSTAHSSATSIGATMSAVGRSVTCSLCQAVVDSPDSLQLHYLTTCTGYERHQSGVSPSEPPPSNEPPPTDLLPASTSPPTMTPAAQPTSTFQAKVSQKRSSPTGTPPSSRGPRTMATAWSTSTYRANVSQITCPLCREVIESPDALQLHYLITCPGYVWHQSGGGSSDPPPCTLTELPPASTRAPRTTPAVQLTSTPRAKPTSSAASSQAMASAGPEEKLPELVTVRFKWQPLLRVSFPSVVLLASFEPGSVQLQLDPQGVYYESNPIAIAPGTYEGQMVVGDSSVNPVKEFTVMGKENTIVLQLAISTGQDVTTTTTTPAGSGYDNNGGYYDNTGSRSSHSNYSDGRYGDGIHGNIISDGYDQGVERGTTGMGEGHDGGTTGSQKKPVTRTQLTTAKAPSTDTKQVSTTSATFLADVTTKEGKMRMYLLCPKNLSSIKVKSQVVVKRSAQRYEQGTLMFYGYPRGKALAGIRLDLPAGTCDGTLSTNGRRYFKCEPRYGLYVNPNMVFLEANVLA